MWPITLYLFTAIIVLATLIPQLEFEQWYIRVLDFPRIQIMFLCLIPILAGLILWRNHELTPAMRVALFANGACLLYQMASIFPYTPLGKKHVFQSYKADNEDNHISLLICNVLYENRNSDKIISLVKEARPDLFLAVETGAWWKDQLDTLSEYFPYRVSVPLENTYGMLLYSSLPLEDQAVKFLAQNDVPSIHTTISLTSGQKIRFFGLHPRPPAPSHADSSLPRDAELIITGKMVHDAMMPCIIAGDMNDVAWSSTTRLFQRTSQTLDPRKGRGMFNTFHADYFFLRWPLDHIFHTNHFKLVSIRRMPHIGSDHFPMFVKLSLEPDAVHVQERPETTVEDEHDAREKIAKYKEFEAQQSFLA